MPELPEVEVTRRGLLPHLLEKRIVSVRLNQTRLRIPVPGEFLEQWISGAIVRAIDRVAKYLMVRMDNNAVMVIHLGMTGKLGIFGTDVSEKKHDHIIFRLHDNTELRFNDTRRFGLIEVWPPEQARSLEEQFTLKQGIDPFSADFTPENLMRLAQRRNCSIKNFLMNGQLVSGIGNIYANEILFAVSIHPQTPACNIDTNVWQQIVAVSRRILNDAIEAGGSTIADFIGSNGKPGYFQLQLKVYGREEAQCPRCTGKIHRIVLGNRATFYCPDCQPLRPFSSKKLKAPQC